MDQSKNLLTVGSVPKKMLLFAVPVFFSNLFQQLYNAADSLIVGNFIGEEALAAVSSSGSLIMLLTGFINGVSMGAGVLIARFYGAQDKKSMERTVHTTVALGIAAGLLLTVVGVLFTPQILRWMGTPETVLPSSIAYFRTYFLGSVAVILYNVGASILQSVGDSRSPMKYLITASLTNIVLDLLFVAVFHWGVASAALATIISQILSAALAFRKLMSVDTMYKVTLRKVRFDLPMLKQIVTLGIPSGVQNSVISLANVIVQRFRRRRNGRLRHLLQAGRICLPAGHLLCAGAVHLYQPEYRRGKVRPRQSRHEIWPDLLAGSGGVHRHSVLHLCPVSHWCVQQQPRCHRLWRAAGADAEPVLLPAFVFALLRRYPARFWTPDHSDDHHAGGLVPVPHHLYHHRGSNYPEHSGGFLGLPHHLDNQHHLVYNFAN